MIHLISKDVLTKVFLGKKINIFFASDKTKQVKGIVQKETKNMFYVKTDKGLKKIPKKEIFFYLDDEKVDGKTICYRLADRIKKYA
jgi:RNase P/RNase MRP subunit p29